MKVKPYLRFLSLIRRFNRGLYEKIKWRYLKDEREESDLDNIYDMLEAEYLSELRYPLYEYYKTLFKLRFGFVFDFETKDLYRGSGSIFSFYDIATRTLKQDYAYNVIKYLDYINRNLVIAHNIDYDLRVLNQELSRDGYKYLGNELVLGNVKGKRILSMYYYKKGDKRLEFCVYDTFNMFPTRLYHLSAFIDKIFRSDYEYLEELFDDDVIRIIRESGLRKGLVINGREYRNEVELRDYLISLYGDDYYKSSEYKLYNLKDTIITAIAYFYLNKLFRFGKTSRKRYYTIASYAFHDMFYSGLKYNKKRSVSEVFRQSYHGGIVYCKYPRDDRGSAIIYGDPFKIYEVDINSCYPFSYAYLSYSLADKIRTYTLDTLGKIYFSVDKPRITYLDDILLNYDLSHYPKVLREVLYNSLLGRCSVIIRGSIKYVDRESLGYQTYLNGSFREGDIKLSVVGDTTRYDYCMNIFKDVYVSGFDVIRCGIRFDSIDKIYVAIHDNPTLYYRTIELYNKRLESKKSNDPFELVYKLILNSCYGKLGQEETYIRKKELDFAETDYDKYSFTSFVEDYYEDDVYVKKSFKKYRNMLRTLEVVKKPYQKIYNVFLASSTTAMARLLLQSYVNYFKSIGYDHVYSDTDSLYLVGDKELDDNKFIGEDLGKIKVSKIDEFIPVAKKIYYKRVGNKMFSRCKGIMTDNSSLPISRQDAIDFIEKGYLVKNSYQKVSLDRSDVVYYDYAKRLELPKKIYYGTCTVDDIIDTLCFNSVAENNTDYQQCYHQESELE